MKFAAIFCLVAAVPSYAVKERGSLRALHVETQSSAVTAREFLLFVLLRVIDWTQLLGRALCCVESSSLQIDIFTHPPLPSPLPI